MAARLLLLLLAAAAAVVVVAESVVDDVDSDDDTAMDAALDAMVDGSDEEEDEEAVPRCATFENDLEDNLIGDSAPDGATDAVDDVHTSCGQCGVSALCKCNDRALRDKYKSKLTGALQLQFLVDEDHLPGDTPKKKRAHWRKMMDAATEALWKELKDVINVRFVASFISGSEKFGYSVSVQHGYQPTGSLFVKRAGEYENAFFDEAFHFCDYMPIWVVDIEGGSPLKGVHGWANMPWKMSKVFLEIEAAPKHFAAAAVHEMGHALGLYHTFHGWEVDLALGKCSACHEASTCRKNKWYKRLFKPFVCSSEGSATTGDLCEDTRPQPKDHYSCRTTRVHTKDKCTKKPWGYQSGANWMSYGCTELKGRHFTKAQKRRMRCTLRNNSIAICIGPQNASPLHTMKKYPC